MLGGREKVIWAGDRKKVIGAGDGGRGPGPGALGRGKVIPSKIKEIRIGNANKVMIDNLKINSIRNKFEQLKESVLKYIGLVVTETILHEAFSESLF